MVADPHHFNVDPDPSLQFNSDPYPTCHFNADPDRAPNRSEVNLRQMVCRPSTAQL